MAQATERGSWAPNWATHPGEHLAEYIETRGWSQADFARIAGLTPKLVSTIVNARNRVTPETAMRLERVLGLKAHVWLGLQDNWDLFQARVTEKDHFAACKEWLARFPVRELKARGALPDSPDTTSLSDALLAFLGVGSPEGYEAKNGLLAVHHRQARRGSSSPEHVFAWLMLGDRAARQMDLPSFDADRFRAAVADIRGLTVARPETFEPRMTELCRASGVALVFEKPLSKTLLFGSARWLEGDRAIIQMSLRMKSNDHFWWTFFHEAGHLLLHRGRNFLDDEKGVGDGPEDEADAWAAEMLVGCDRLRRFAERRPRSEAQVKSFADQVGLHPGIVVGMLQHRGVLPYSHLNALKDRFDWNKGEAAA